MRFTVKETYGFPEPKRFLRKARPETMDPYKSLFVRKFQ